MKSSAPFEVNVSSKYGAPMGRPSDALESFKGARVQLRAVAMVDGDYDAGGAYWGGGRGTLGVWCAWGTDAEGEPIEAYVRAKTRKDAKAQFKGATFYKVIRRAKRAPDSFVAAYITCALWSSTDNSDDSGGEPLDKNYSEDDIAPETLKAMRADCDAFYVANSADLSRVADDSRAGHDFWLTRNGHGAGFWDRGLGALGDRLTKASKTFGGVDLYVGDDGKIYG
jgi:hypothetical protein